MPVAPKTTCIGDMSLKQKAILRRYLKKKRWSEISTNVELRKCVLFLNNSTIYIPGRTSQDSMTAHGKFQ